MIKNQGLEQNIFSRIVKNTFWMFNSSVIVRFFNFVKSVILARLLFPDDFGLFGLAMIVVGFVEMFSDVGAGASLIYKQKEINAQYINSAFWVNIAVSTLLAVGVICASPMIAAFYERSDLVPVFVVMAVSLWFQVASNVHKSILRRDLQFKKISFIEIFVSFISLVVAVVMGLAGYGVWALVGSILVGNVLNALLYVVVSKWMPLFQIDSASVKQLAPFSGSFWGEAIAWYVVFSLGSLVIGKMLDMSALGLYTIANNYSLMAITIVANPLGNVSYPELAKVLDKPSKFWNLYFKISKLLIGYVAPIVCSLVIVAPDLIPLVLGSKWGGAIVPFQILLVYVLIRCLWSDPLSSLGKFKLSMITGVVTALIAFVCMLFASSFGVVGISLVVLIVVGCSHILSLYIASSSLSVWAEGFKNAFPYVATSLVAGMIAFCVRHFVVANLTSSKELLVVVPIVVMFAIYGAVFFGNLCKLFASLRGEK